MFLYVFIGLAVVSLFINLVHVKVSKAYWLELSSHPYAQLNQRKINNNEPEPTKAFVESFADEETVSDLDLGSCVTLGILQMQERRPLLRPTQSVPRVTKTTQTNVSVPTKKVVQIEQNMHSGHRVVPEGTGGFVYQGSRSMDDVQRLLYEVYD